MSFDPETFKAYTFFGKRFSAERIDRIQQILDATPGISRTGLAMRVAEALKWRNPDGRPKFRACLGALERLEELGILTLPLNRVKKRASGLDAVDVSLAIRETPVTDSLDALQPITLQRQSRGREDLERVRRPSPLSGLQAPLRLSDEVFHHGWRILGCLLFEGMTRTLQCRDRLIGAAQKNRTRHLVVVNSRFVIFAGVRVPNLASAALGLAATARRLASKIQLPP